MVESELEIFQLMEYLVLVALARLILRAVALVEIVFHLYLECIVLNQFEKLDD